MYLYSIGALLESFIFYTISQIDFVVTGRQYFIDKFSFCLFVYLLNSGGILHLASCS